MARVHEGHPDTNSLVNPSLSSVCSIGRAPLQTVGTGLSTQKLLVGGFCQPSGKDRVILTVDFQHISTHMLIPTPIPQRVCCSGTFLFLSLSLHYDLTPKTWVNTPSGIRGWLAGWPVLHYGILFTFSPAPFSLQSHSHGNSPPWGNKYGQQNPTCLICLMFYFSKNSLERFKLAC